MFIKNNKNAGEAGEIDNSHNILSNGTTLEGSITTAGNLRIDGKIIGSITSKGKLILGPNAFVQGTIMAENAAIEGSLEGTINVSGLLTLKRTATIQGDISTGKLIFEEGAQFNGKCKMDTNPLDKSKRRPDVSEVIKHATLSEKKPIQPKPILQHETGT